MNPRYRFFVYCTILPVRLDDRNGKATGKRQELKQANLFIICILIAVGIGGNISLAQTIDDPATTETVRTRTRVIVEGTIFDEATGDSLPHVTIQALGTGMATKANADARRLRY